MLYLATRKLRLRRVAAAITEVALVFAAIVLVTGSIWARIIWGVWWAWDARLTIMLICWLIFAGYLMLAPRDRGAHAARAAFGGGERVRSVDAVIVYKSIEWWRTLHPGPVLTIRNGGGMAPGMESAIYWNLLALVCLASCW